MTDLLIRQGGLMRCCIKSLLDYAPADPEENEGHNCNWCSNPMVFRDGAWEWDHE